MTTRNVALVLACVLALSGCQANKKACITAVSLNNDCHWGEETGIPFYLPKPLLIVSKNFRNIETPTVGLTDSAPIPNGYDDQAKYADLNARTNFNFDGGTGTTSQTQSGTSDGNATKSGQILHSESGAPVTPFNAPSDGLGPDTFYTYHIVFVPDLTQKYGLRIRGGPGEIRAAMNLVNGWQYTGMGPYYSKDSSSAQNILAGGISARLGGQAANDVLSGVADLAGSLPGGGTQSGSGESFNADDPRVQSLSQTISQLPSNMAPMVIPQFAEIHVFEPSLGPDGMMTWSEIAACSFNREYLGVKTTKTEFAPQTSAAPVTNPGGGSGTQSAGEFSSDVANTAIASIFGVPGDSAAIQPIGGGQTQSGGEAGNAVPSGSVIQSVNVNCGPNCQKPCCKPHAESRHWLRLPRLGHRFQKQEKPKVERRTVVLPAGANLSSNASTRRQVDQGGGGQNDLGDTLESVGGGTQSGGEFNSQSAGEGAIFNQPILNQPRINQPTVLPAPEPAGDGT